MLFKYGCSFPFALTLTMVLVPSAMEAQDGDPVKISLGTVRTQLEQMAFQYAVEYAKEFSSADVMVALDGGALYFTPEIDLTGGEADAFNNIIAKLTGSWLLFSTTSVMGIETPNTSFFHTIPFSVGIETSNLFDNANLLGEVGYVPWFQGSVSDPFKALFVGAFVQGGYKAELDDPVANGEEIDGGNADESSELPGSGLFRLKGRGVFSQEVTIEERTGLGLGIEGSGDVWYDLLNSEVYYSVEATFRILIGEGKSFDLSYQKGSGAPNFNEGDQFGAGLTVEF